jgi:SAM-dependent methyltransferase
LIAIRGRYVTIRPGAVTVISVEREVSGDLGGRLDTSTPNVARINHHFLGGRETFQADRDAAEQVLSALPGMRAAALAGRDFIGRAVRYLAGGAGVDQFLDLGTGLPAAPAVHEIAQAVNPAARTAYVDFDPVVVSHGNAMLARPGVAVVVQGDLRRPAELLAQPDIGAHLDFSRPVAVLLVSVLAFVADADDPYAIVAKLRRALAPGSFLVLSHLGLDLLPGPGAARRLVAAYEKANAPVTPRTQAQVRRLFDRFELVEPGLVPKPEWRPDRAGDTGAADVDWCGVGRLPDSARPTATGS